MFLNKHCSLANNKPESQLMKIYEYFCDFFVYENMSQHFNFSLKGIGSGTCIVFDGDNVCIHMTFYPFHISKIGTQILTKLETGPRKRG